MFECVNEWGALKAIMPVLYEPQKTHVNNHGYACLSILTERMLNKNKNKDLCIRRNVLIPLRSTPSPGELDKRTEESIMQDIEATATTPTVQRWPDTPTLRDGPNKCIVDLIPNVLIDLLRCTLYSAACVNRTLLISAACSI